MKMLIDGEFIDKNEHYDVINPYDGELIDTTDSRQGRCE